MSTTGPGGRVLLIVAAVIALLSVGYAITRGADKETVPQKTASQATQSQDASDVIRALQERVGADPKDAGSWQKLGWVYFESGKYGDAARAYRRATELKPDNAAFWSGLGEALVMADERDPMPQEASKAFEKALNLDPKDPRARYFHAVVKDLAGDHRGAIDDWFALLRDTPSGAPWEKDLARTIEQVGKINDIEVAARLAAIKPAAPDPHEGMAAPPSAATAAIPGPSRDQMQAASALPKNEQDAMIAGMVASLEGKLKASPGNVDGWLMLMRSRMTLNEPAKASATLKAAIAANPDREQYLREQASLIAVPGA